MSVGTANIRETAWAFTEIPEIPRIAAMISTTSILKVFIMFFPQLLTRFVPDRQ